MIKKDKSLEKQKQLFHKMAAEELGIYCTQHPYHSLAVGIRNQRMKDAFEIMEDCAKDLTQRDRKILSVYVQETFGRGCVDVSPQMLHTLYAPLLTDPDFEQPYLQKAFDEFLGFAKTPMNQERHTLLKQFVKHIDITSQQSSSHDKTAEAYIKLATLIPNKNIIAL